MEWTSIKEIMNYVENHDNKQVLAEKVWFQLDNNGSLISGTKTLCVGYITEVRKNKHSGVFYLVAKVGNQEFFPMLTNVKDEWLLEQIEFNRQ